MNYKYIGRLPNDMEIWFKSKRAALRFMRSEKTMIDLDGFHFGIFWKRTEEDETGLQEINKKIIENPEDFMISKKILKVLQDYQKKRSNKKRSLIGASVVGISIKDSSKIIKFRTASEAAKKLKLKNANSLRRSCREKGRSAAGYFWHYE